MRLRVVTFNVWNTEGDPRRLDLINRFGFDWIGVDERTTDVPQRVIHGVSESVNHRRLAVARDDQARPAVGLEILGDRIYPHRRDGADSSWGFRTRV